MTSTTPISRDLDQLVAEMTLDEKLGQLNVPIPRLNLPAVPGADLREAAPATLEEMSSYAAGSFADGIGPGGGFYLLPLAGADARAQAEIVNTLQATAAATGHGIPMLMIAEGCHGVIGAGHTIFPEGLALGSSWNPALIEDVYASVAREARAVGVHMLSTLVVEPNRDPRLGRNCEGYSEDPYLLSRITEAIVKGAQGPDVSAPDRAVAILTCFPGQSEPVSGLERGAMELSERTLREVFLPSWQAGISGQGALGVMATYPAIDGIPCHASAWLLTTVLRDELGFDGIVVSEGSGIETLVYESVASDQSEAGVMALEAGVDVGISWEPAFARLLRRNVEDGRAPMELIDRAVRRVLEVKQRLGLFENAQVDVDRAVATVHSRQHVELARQAAREGIVLLKNDGDLLPLSPRLGTIAVIGPNADAANNQLGDYTMAMIETDRPVPDVVTVLDGIRAAAPGSEVRYAKGCDVIGDDTTGFADAVRAATGADVAIVVVGEQQGSWIDAEHPTTVGELCDVASLDLTGVQDELVKAVVATGTPTVVVLVNGRPLSTCWIAEHVPAVVEAWLPGEQGGHAVADVVFGAVNPSGRLPISVPRHSGQLPIYYNQRWARWHIRNGGMGFVRGYVDMPATPLYPFGFGLSYTRWEYANVTVSPTVGGEDATFSVAVDVTNVGTRAGAETVQLYVRDVKASVAPRVKELRGFTRVELQPGETTTVTFELDRRHLSMLDADMRWVVEPGVFEAQVGSSSDDIHGTARFEVAPA